MKSDALPCIVCNKPLTNVFACEEDHFFNQPNNGLAFVTYGHYGSTVFDHGFFPGQNHLKLEINVCDDCIRKHVDRIALVAIAPRRTVETAVSDQAKREHLGL